MNKKILLGSIIAVAILVLVSFTGVVGYQTTKSSAITKVSPLFNIRSKRAIGQGQKDITTNYLGHGEETSIQFSSRIKRTEQIQKAINIISKMDDKAFSRFVVRIIFHLKNQKQMTDKETSDTLQILDNIRRNPNDKKYYDTKNNPIVKTFDFFTCGFLYCVIWPIIEPLIWLLLFIITFIHPKCYITPFTWDCG